MINKGFLTYDAEGQEGGPFHSRKLHVPSENSGLTIGRGYDMKERTQKDILQHMTSAGVKERDAHTLSLAAGLSGSGAKDFIEQKGLSQMVITMQAQERLFNTVYAGLEKDVKRICSKSDCVAAYGSVDWEGLSSKIKDVLVDLRFRGDYAPWSRKLIQRHVSNNDLSSFKSVISDRKVWASVPLDRFQRRISYLS